MNINTFPTKGNLIASKNSLALARQGYGLMDKKRNILIRELMYANIELGIDFVSDVAGSVPVEDSIQIKTRSVMGTEIPLVRFDDSPMEPTYAYYATRESLDKARECFNEVKRLTVKLSMIENSAYRLASNIKKTQKRANALRIVRSLQG